MGTENRRVATYLPKEIDDRLKAFISERGLKGDSLALITILSEYFGVAQKVDYSVDYSAFVSLEQFQELALKVEELTQAIRSDTTREVLGELLERLSALESQVQNFKAATPSQILSTGELAKRLGMPASSLSHWKSSDPKRGKSPDELLKATREKDPDQIGWILIPESGKFKPEREILSSSLGEFQGELLSAKTINQVSPLPEGSERSGEG